MKVCGYICRSFKLVALLAVIFICTSCSGNNKNREPFIRVKKYNYETNEKVNVRIRGFDNCKLKIEPEKFLFLKKIPLTSKRIRIPKSRLKKPLDDGHDDLFHF